MILDQAFLANTLILLLMPSVQFGAFGDLFGGEDDSPTEDSEEEPLFDSTLYTQRIDGTPNDDAFTTIDGEIAQAYFLGAGADQISATPGDDYISGGDGDDFVEALDGNDIVFGGNGLDQIFAGRGDDQVFGDAGNDLLEGSLGNDRLDGGEGDDQLSGGRGDDTLIGGAGDDILNGDRFDETSNAARGVDALDGGAGNDTLWLVGNDTGTGGEGEDLFRVFDSDDPEALVEITDFDRSADRIEVIYSPEADAAAPDLTVTSVADTDDVRIALDGVEIANVTRGSGLSVEDITLTANPTAQDVPSA